MSVLAKNEIWKLLEIGSAGSGLTVTPLVNGTKAIGPCSIDVHLGHEYIVFRRAKVTAIDVANVSELENNVYRYQEKARIGRGQKFVLHPHQLVLAASIEYISLPLDIYAEIGGRSTWGRTGLIIATATKIDPGFKGCVTLELVNSGEVPLVLYPGLCVAQLVLRNTGKNEGYEGRYKYPTGPEFPKFNKELESGPMKEFYRPCSFTNTEPPKT